jgi:hypothetical protein
MTKLFDLLQRCYSFDGGFVPKCKWRGVGFAVEAIMKSQLSVALAGACALLGATAAANASTFTMTLEQVGSNVVETGSGSIDLTGLTMPAGSSTPHNHLISNQTWEFYLLKRLPSAKPTKA